MKHSNLTRVFFGVVMIGILPGCITSYTCEGDHKETYNNISPTTQASDTTTSQGGTPLQEQNANANPQSDQQANQQNNQSFKPINTQNKP